MKLNCLGLSHPEKGVKEAFIMLEYPHEIRDILKEITGEIEKYLGPEAQKEGYNNYSGHTLLLGCKANELQDQLNDDSLRASQLQFQQNWAGYFFSHGFIYKNYGDKKGGDISTVFIDSDIVRETKFHLGNSFIKFEKSIGCLYACANHDYTHHRYGIATSGGPSLDIDQYLRDNLRILSNSHANATELLAAIFHLDLIAEISESSPKIHKIIEKNCRIVLRGISQIKDVAIREYWTRVFKYPLFSILSANKTGKNGKNVFQSLKNDFSEIDFSMNLWGKALQIEQIPFQDTNFPIREFRKIVMDSFRKDDEQILIQYLRDNGIRNIKIKESFLSTARSAMDQFFIKP